MKALHFGAGNIGRGFIGKLLADAGIHVTFADIDDKIIGALNHDKQYPVRIVAEGVDTIETVHNVDGINSKDTDGLIQAITSVDLITTAVGPTVLEIIAPTLAKGLLARLEKGNTTPLNIIACENMVRGTSFLKEKVFANLNQEQQVAVSKTTGFVDSAVDRIVPPVQASADQPLLVTVELFSEWIVDQTQFVGPIPKIPGMELTDNLMAFVERKLFTLNTGHATTAYLGKLAGIQQIKEAIANAEIHQTVKSVMQESGAVLIKRYGFDADKHQAYIEKILGRFANPYLTDDVDRVGRQPLRKLSPADRLIKPLNGMLEYDLPHDQTITAIAAALHYRNNDDPQAVELANAIEKNGLSETVKHYTQLEDNALIETIISRYQTLS